MPKYTVNGPDGKSYTVNAPEGATHDDAIDYVQQNFYTQSVDMPTAKRSKNEALLQAIKNSPVGGFVRGLRDIPDAGAQLLTRGLQAVAPAGSGFEKYMQGEVNRVDEINRNAEQDYRQNFRQGEDTGLDAGRIAGNIVGTLPAAAPFALRQGAGALAKAASGAGMGATSAALMPVQDTENFGEEKGKQLLLGGLTGAAAPFVADAVTKLVSKVGSRLHPGVASNLEAELTARGVDYSKLSKEMQESLAKDANAALKAGKELDFDALSRKADFEVLGIKPTTGQLTRDPMQYQFEQNTRGIVGGGETLSNRFNEQNTGLLNAINARRGGNIADPYDAGQAIQSALKASDDTAKSNVTNLYDIAKNSAGINVPLNPRNFTDNLFQRLDDEMVGDALPSGVRKTLNSIATGEMPFTIQKAEQMRRAINGQMPKIPGPDSVALKMVNDALQNEIDNVGSGLGGQAGEAFKQARATASQRFAGIEQSPALRTAIDEADPIDFVNKHVIRAKPSELMALRSNLKDNPDLWNEARGQVIDFLKNKATSGQPDEFAKFSQSGFKNGLNSIGDARLKILFNADEIAELKRIQRVAASIQVQPVGSAVNNSGTSQAVSNLLSRLSGVPYLRELVANPLINFRMQSQVNSALNPGNVAGQAAKRVPAGINPLTLPIAIGGQSVANRLTE